MLQLLYGLSVVGVPVTVQGANESGEDFSVIHGLEAAVQAMCECSEIQHEKRTTLTENATKVLQYTNLSNLMIKSIYYMIVLC